MRCLPTSGQDQGGKTLHEMDSKIVLNRAKSWKELLLIVQSVLLKWQDLFLVFKDYMEWGHHIVCMDWYALCE